MKKIFFLFLLVFSSSFVSAQYFEVGMKWTYAHGVGLPPVNFVIHSIEIVGDTVVDGETWYVLDGRCNCSPEVKLIHQEGQKVFYRWAGEKHLLYDYALGAGDSLQIQFPHSIDDSLHGISMIIDATEVVDFGGQNIMTQQMSYAEPNTFGADFGQKFAEGLGSLDFCLFPQDGLCEEGSYLRCITYADGTVIKFTDDPDCYIVGTDDIELSGISLQPNPVTDYLRIENPDNHSFTIQVFNQQGQLMLAQKEIRASAHEIIAKGWVSGTYMVRLVNKEGVFTRMIVKE